MPYLVEYDLLRSTDRDRSRAAAERSFHLQAAIERQQANPKSRRSRRVLFGAGPRVSARRS